MTVKLIKTVGLLGIVGEASVNLKNSKALLRYALDAAAETFRNEADESVQSFESALMMLEGRSIVIYRRYNDAYALWEGSDIDIEARLREAAGHLDPMRGKSTTSSAESNRFSSSLAWMGMRTFASLS